MRPPWAVALLLLLGLRYLSWRASDTLNLDTPLAAAISVTALVAEMLLLVRWVQQRLGACHVAACLASHVSRRAGRAASGETGPSQ